MASSIKLFQFIQRYHETVGMRSTQTNKRRSQIFLIFAMQYMILQTIFLIIEANSMFDYGFGFFMAICVATTTIIYFLFKWQLKNTLTIIEDCERFISQSECLFEISSAVFMKSSYHCISYIFYIGSTIAYREFVEKIELFNKYFCVAISISVAFCFITPLPYSYLRYFVYDMGEESFFLFAPCWFVHSVLYEIEIHRYFNNVFSLHIGFGKGFHLIGEHHLDIYWHIYLKAPVA